MKIILGSGQTKQEGWIATDSDTLDLLSDDSFKHFFKEQKAQAMLAEHVWEHFTFEEGVLAATNCYHHLEAGGYLRCAVPDGNLRNDAFLKLVGVGGPGPIDHPAYSHKILYTYKQFVELFEQSGFVVSLLEYCDDDGHFHYHYWNADDGKIGRSFRYDTRNSIEQIGMASIIIDAYKPLTVSHKKD